MKKKHIITFLFLFLGMVTLCHKNTSLAAEKGQVTFSLAVEEEKIEEYQKENEDGAGIYVYVKNLDTNQTYRFPMNKANDYVGTFQIEHGNYQVVPKPEADNSELVVKTDSVFTISDSVPIIEIKCYLETKEKKTKPAISTQKPIQENASQNKEEATGSGFSIFQKIFTLVAFLAIGAIWVYNRFIKYRIGGGNRFLDD